MKGGRKTQAFPELSTSPCVQPPGQPRVADGLPAGVLFDSPSSTLLEFRVFY